MLNGIDRRATHEVLTRLFMLNLDSTQRRRSRQQRTHVQFAVPPELQVPLLDASGVIAEPRTPEVDVGMGLLEVG